MSNVISTVLPIFFSLCVPLIVPKIRKAISDLADSHFSFHYYFALQHPISDETDGFL
jgi:hypothetical protein